MNTNRIQEIKEQGGFVAVLKTLSSRDNVAREILKHVGNEAETEVTAISNRANVDRISTIRFFKKLESLGMGKFIAGRKGHKSRFAWDLEPRERRETPREPLSLPLPAPRPEPRAGRQNTWNFPLRRGFVVSVALPEDLTVEETERLTAWLLTLPIVG